MDTKTTTLNIGYENERDSDHPSRKNECDRQQIKESKQKITQLTHTDVIGNVASIHTDLTILLHVHTT